VIPSTTRDTVAVRLSDPTCELSDIAGALEAAGVHATSIQLHPATLEDVFLAKTGRADDGPH
jgi:hypothetical protein